MMSIATLVDDGKLLARNWNVGVRRSVFPLKFNLMSKLKNLKNKILQSEAHGNQ